MDALTWPTVALAIGVTAVSVLYLLTHRPRRLPLPPGPPSLPLIGAGWALAKKGRKVYETVEVLRQQYGDVYRIAFPTGDWVIVSGFDNIRELLVVRGADFAHRPEDYKEPFFNPQFPVRGLVDANYTPEWKRQKSVSLQLLRSLGYGRGTTEQRIQEECEHLRNTFEQRMTEQEYVSPHEHVSISVSNVICSLLFNERYEDPRMVTLVDNLFAKMSIDSAADYAPFLRLLLPNHTKARNSMKTICDEMGEFYKKKIAERQEFIAANPDSPPRDFIEGYLRSLDNDDVKLGEDRLLSTLQDFFMAGSETTSTSLNWTFLYLANYPNVQSKVQEELDALVGQQLHTFSLEERSRLPYTEAMIMEIQRLSSIAFLTLWHTCLEDMEFGGYTIEKGSKMACNLRGLHYDPSIWGPNPEEFRPERFIDEAGKLVRPEQWIPFSMGRRVCFGEQLARQELFLFTTMLVHKFKVLPHPAHPLPPVTEPLEEFVLKPQPYKVVLQNRLSVEQ